MSARNALCLHDLYIHPSNLWQPKPNGASDWIRTMPHFFNSPCVSALGAVSVHSPPSEGWQAQPDGVVAKGLHQVRCRYIPLLRRGGRRSLAGWSLRGTVEKVSSACNRNRLRREYLQTTRRGGLACPPVTRCAYTIYTFIHPIYGNQNQMAQVIGFVRCRTFSTVPAYLH